MISIPSWTVFIEWFINEETQYYALYIFFLGGAFLNFLPQIMGFTLRDSVTGEYPESLFKLSDSFAFKASIIASLGATAPFILDYFLEYFSFLFETDNTSKKTQRNAYIPFQDVFLLLVIPDLLFLFYVLPNHNYDFLPGLIGFRDTLYIFCFTSFMVQLKTPIWKWNWAFWFVFSIMSANVLATTQTLTSDPIYLQAVTVILKFVVSLAIATLLFVTTRWFAYALKTTDEENRVRNNLCSVYVIFFVIFFLADWIPFLIPDPIPEDWATNTGVITMSLYTYLLAMSFIAIAVVSSRLAKNQASEFKSTLKVKQTFMRYISHEIRTPLNIVFLGLKSLEEDTATTDNASFVNTLHDIKDSCLIALGVLNDMLMYDKIECGLLVLELENLNPWCFIRSVYTPFLLQAREAGVVISLELCETYPDFEKYLISADKSKLSQVIRNLVSNAIRFTPRGGKVQITAEIVQMQLRIKAPKLNSSTSSYAKPTRSRCCDINKIMKCLKSRSQKKIVAGYGNSLTNTKTNVHLSNGIGSGTSSKNIHSSQRKSIVKRDHIQLCHEVLILKVLDSGVGISKENQSKLFHSAAQFNAGKDQGGGGSGLGLLISKNITDCHNGQLAVTSTGEGKGSTFSLTLPLYRIIEPSINRMSSHKRLVKAEPFEKNDSSSRIESKSYHPQHENNYDVETGISSLRSKEPVVTSICCTKRPSGSFNTNQLKILVVDDSKINCKFICKVLSKNDRVCDQAEDGQVAVDMVKEKGIEYYDIIFMDYQMPRKIGPIAIQDIRDMNYSGHIIGLTGNALKVDTDRMMNAGADKVFIKPIDVDVLIEFVTNIESMKNQDSSKNDDSIHNF